MNAIRFRITVDDDVTHAIPDLQSMKGRHVEVIAFESDDSAPRKSGTLAEFLEHRLQRPPEMEPITLADMQRAIEEGALGGDL